MSPSSQGGSSSKPSLTQQARAIWPTPCAADSQRNSANHQRGEGNPTLPGSAQMWRTPDATLIEPKSTVVKMEGRTPADPQVSLADQATRMWPTPDASAANDTEIPAAWKARQQRTGLDFGMPLAMAAKFWPTPKTPMGGAEGRSSRAKRGSGGEDLEAAAQEWPTPNAEGGTGYMSGSNRDTWRPTLEGMAIGKRPVLHSGRPDPTMPPDGPRSTRVLNPRFVEWLMGWPLGWTDCGSSATESYRLWRQRHSSALRSVLASWTRR